MNTDGRRRRAGDDLPCCLTHDVAAYRLPKHSGKPKLSRARSTAEADTQRVIPFRTAGALRWRSGLDPMVCATAFGLLRHRMTKAKSVPANLQRWRLAEAPFAFVILWR
ncbi:hypothetical protein, partial [Kumtagia ephedrae]|uniref:hypothetical protein n=1 Tax=Kumtagia ephedrae TaxID=2116701 RepID=UPI001A9CAEE1